MAIYLKNVKFSYPGPANAEAAVLDIREWHVHDSQHVFVYGPSGGGKSTLLNLLSGMLSPTEGEVSILGERIDQMSIRKRDNFRANHIGYVFQQFNLISYLNAVENIQLALHFSKHKQSASKTEKIDELLTTLNISKSDRLKPTSALSIGQQQRVAIARALINEPELLIADEPTSSLDQENRDTFMSLLLSLVAENKSTLVFVSHDMSLSTHFQRIDDISEINYREEK